MKKRKKLVFLSISSISKPIFFLFILIPWLLIDHLTGLLLGCNFNARAFSHTPGILSSKQTMVNDITQLS